MSELLQSGQFPGASGHHPGADQLNAFLEQALPAHEREQVLAHLAVCPDCRETVALSLPQLETPPAAEPARRPARTPWLRGWSIFVPAALALAASVFFVVHVRHAGMKGSIPEPARIAAAQAPLLITPAQQAPASSMATPETRARAANRVAAPAPSAVENQQLDALAAPPQAALPAAAVIAGENKNAAIGSMHGSIGGLAAPAPAPAPPPPATNAPLDSATQTVAAAGEAPSPATIDAALEPRAIAPIPQPVVLEHPLPSGLAALATAASGRAMLAIDTHNTVFLSNDSGEHWTAVPATWKGRAVKINLVSHATGFAQAAGAASGSGMAAFANAARLAPAANASLTGVITDAAGAVIPGVTVTLHNVSTNTGRTVTTDANGRYLADGLTPGSYNIEATAPGFIAQRAAGVAVQASRQTAENLTLQVGSVSETVTVEAEAQPMASPRAAKSKTLKSALSAVPPQAVFEITTDTGERWTSADGILWQHE